MLTEADAREAAWAAGLTPREAVCYKFSFRTRTAVVTM
jgi:hypothetical protein